jgi:hypothetical protein
MNNAVHNIDTKWIRNESGEFPALVMGLDIFDLQNADEFLDSVVERFKLQRMMSPPQTANMSVTIAGDMTAEDFCRRWRERVRKDSILAHFMSLMVVAVVLHISGRDLLDRASLLPEAN